ncbi:uncharacterized protein LOC107411112 [Ziziphus jujuba]|uniref:Uncharacterized protein LOC107411112 n=2 Tax=Ziziphus jujuba TaxID=326968 RepID=A0A6P6FW46_ZIZJJ|nr:uncharacterized protein LOC107411112 [Ziziphus jujuba]KAH7542472.1 hypothetical protein FEM48_Zijuj02G0077400 [Ziziphus jujuba var. spinosa]
MTSFSGLGLSLSIVFGCLLLALVAELYYLLWWKKKRITDREIEDEYRNFAKELFHSVCWKRPSPVHTNETKEIRDHHPDAIINGHEPDLELGGSTKDLLLKTNGEEGVESELMRLHNLAGPPRFLFTIKEETKEDLESEDGKSRGDRSRKGSRTRSLSDLIVAVDTPFLTPLASPPLKSSPLNPLDSYKHHGFNPLFESTTTEAERFKSSPPPKFKFLRDAEEKLYRRLMEEAEKRASQNCGSAAQDSMAKTQAPFNSTTVAEDQKDGSFLTFIVGKNKERELNHHHHHRPQYSSSSSQVLPLASSPTAFRPLDKKSTVQ